MLCRIASVIGMLLAFPLLLAGGPPLPKTSPSRAGFSADRLRTVDSYCDGLVNSGRYSGLVVLIARDGRIVEWRGTGFLDRNSGAPMEKDSIFAIASLSKIITSVAALMLVEEGRLTLREPIAKFLPEFANMKVLVGGTADAPELVDARQPITLHHLLTHTAGFSAFDPTNAPVLAELRRRRPGTPATLRAMAESLAAFPLQSQPGEAWIYGPSTDLVGALVEQVSGMPFDRFLEQRLFRPLHLLDTGFSVPAEKQSRQVSMDVRQPDGSLQTQPPRIGAAWPSGGGGLFSTPSDYLRFAQMLLNGGELDGVRILSPKTVALMTQDHLHGLSKPTRIYPASDGFGYGVEVRTDLARGQWLGSEGTFGWNGATTCYCAWDPREKLIALIWAQHQPNAEFELYEHFNNLLYGALVETR